MVEFKDVCTLEYGASLPKKKRKPGPFPVVGSNGITGWHDSYLIEGPAIIVGRKGSAGEVGWIAESCFPIDTTYYVRLKNDSKTNMRFLFHMLKNVNLTDLRGGGAVPGLNRNDVYQTIRLPLPPLEVQEKIVAELNGYQKIIDGAKQIVENYKPTIKIDPEWPLVEVGDKSLFQIESGGTPSSNKPEYWNGDIKWITLVDLPQENFITDISDTKRKITKLGLNNSSAKLLPIKTVLVSSRATIGRIAISETELATNQGFKNVIIKDFDKVNEKYLAYMFTLLVPQMEQLGTGGTYKEISRASFSTLRIPLPSLKIQEKIVAEIESERELVEANKKLVEIFEKKIKDKIGEVWGE